MKAYTDIEQSKKLAEILPLKSADMWWNYYSVTTDFGTPQIIHLDTPWVGSFNWYNEPDNIPCWSLAALLNAVDFSTINLHYDNARIDWVASATIYDSTKHCTKYESAIASNPVDACVAMIIKLKELKML